MIPSIGDLLAQGRGESGIGQGANPRFRRRRIPGRPATGHRAQQRGRVFRGLGEVQCGLRTGFRDGFKGHRADMAEAFRVGETHCLIPNPVGILVGQADQRGFQEFIAPLRRSECGDVADGLVRIIERPLGRDGVEAALGAWFWFHRKKPVERQCGLAGSPGVREFDE